MALSNILNESRREITESAIPIALICPIPLADYWFATWVRSAGKTDSILEGVGMGLVVGGCMFFLIVVFVGVVYLFIMFTHIIGEGVCNTLQRRGIHLRLRERRQTNS